jgi:hypothetical protein
MTYSGRASPGYRNRDTNLYAFVGNNPINLYDPLGLETFILHRQLNPTNSTQRYPVRERLLSHTFVYTKNKDGSLKNTYSWGNEKGPDGNSKWHKDRSEDMVAARTTIAHNKAYNEASTIIKMTMDPPYGKKVGNDSLDPKVEEAFQDREQDPNHESRREWEVSNNCKHEAERLIGDAKTKLEEEAAAAAAAAAEAERLRQLQEEEENK